MNNQVKNLDELAHAVIDEINSELPKTNKVVGFVWRIAFSHKVSNSHCSPKNGVSNWSGKDEAPTGYPGFTGRVWIRLKNDNKPTNWASDLFRNTLTYTGTGGYGTYDGIWSNLSTLLWKTYKRDLPAEWYEIQEVQAYSWDYRFFESDFPKLEAQRVFDVLANNKAQRHRFQWECPEQQRKDDKMFVIMNELNNEKIEDESIV